MEFGFARPFLVLGAREACRQNRTDMRSRGAANKVGASIRGSFRYGQRCEKFLWAATRQRDGRARDAILLGGAAFKVGPIGSDVQTQVLISDSRGAKRLPGRLSGLPKNSAITMSDCEGDCPDSVA
jgi:hypothetical protein